MRARRGLFGFLAAGALALLAGRALAGLYADWALHDAHGFGELWRLKATTVAALRGGALMVAGLYAFAHFYAVRQSIVSLVLPSRLGGLDIPEEIPASRLTAVALLLAVLVAVGFALLPVDWAQAALAWDTVRFGEVDPYLQRDLGFYVTWLPWERTLQARAMALTLALGVLVTALYALTPSLRWTSTGLYVSTWVRRHLAVLGGSLVALIGWGWNIDRFERLSPGSGVWLDASTEAVFSAFDHRIALPYRALAAFATLPIAAVLVYAGWRGYLRTALTMLGTMVLLGPVASAVLPLVAKEPLATPQGRASQRPYANAARLYTRRAFGVDDIARSGVAAIAPARLGRSVSAWDPAALAAIADGGRRRDSTVGVAWRAGASGLEAIAVQRPTGDGPWGSLRVAANGADDAGHPFYAPSLGDGRFAEVRVHPGAGDAVLVADRRGDIAAPAFETTTQRIALAWAEQDPRLLLRDVPAPRPRLLLERDVDARLRRLLPFVVLGPTLTPHVRGDSLYWFLDAFTVATRYPLSDAVTLGGRPYRYIQHAATVVVQAQTGQVVVIPTERPDPLLRAWMGLAPSTFTPLAAAPEWIRRERPPSVDWMLVQGGGLALVGFPDDSVGARRLTRPDDADADLAVGGPTFFALDSSGTLGAALPVDLPWAGRTLGILVARGGAERRTEYLVDESPRWTTILESLQGAADRAGFGRSLPNARRGRVQAIPTTEGAVWVQSYYDWPRDGEPRLAGVVVSRDGNTVAGRTLSEALGERRRDTQLTADAFRARVTRLYDAMQAALAAGDWRAYGEAWAALGALLRP
jgi:uncharacterized membrane protein (UPF0182 family)